MASFGETYDPRALLAAAPAITLPRTEDRCERTPGSVARADLSPSDGFRTRTARLIRPEDATTLDTSAAAHPMRKRSVPRKADTKVRLRWTPRQALRNTGDAAEITCQHDDACCTCREAVALAASASDALVSLVPQRNRADRQAAKLRRTLARMIRDGADEDATAALRARVAHLDTLSREAGAAIASARRLLSLTDADTVTPSDTAHAVVTAHPAADVRRQVLTAHGASRGKALRKDA